MIPKPELVVVRPPGDSFRDAISHHPDRNLIDPAEARAQHAAYRRALEEAGIQVIELPPDEAHPDSCFTQDPALVIDGHMLALRAGAPSREGEADSLAENLSSTVETIERMEPPGTLEGGDLLVLPGRLLVGLSRRTNRAGIHQLAAWAKPLGYSVEAIPVPKGVLHLSTAATILSERLVIGLPAVIDDLAFDGMEKVPVGSPLAACNLLMIGDRALASGDYSAHDRLDALGFRVIRLDLSQFVWADAGPTCLSLVVSRSGESATG